MEVSGKFEGGPPGSIKRVFQKLFAKGHFYFPPYPQPEVGHKTSLERAKTKERSTVNTSFSRATGRKRGANGEFVLKEVCEDEAWAGKNKSGEITALVADGVSMAKNGGFMASVLAREISHSYYADRNSLLVAIYRAWAWTRLDVRGNKSASTVTALSVNQNERKVVITSAGDSPAFLLRNGRVYELTKKHNVYEDSLRRGGTRQEAEAKGLHKKKNFLTKSINAQGAYQRPDIREERFLPGDLFILASDGFEKGFRSKEEMLPFFEEAGKQKYPATFLVNESLKRQHGKNYIDDIAVAVVQL